MTSAAHLEAERVHASSGAVLEVNSLSVVYDSVRALQNVSFNLARGEILGLVGESGSGKSTAVRAIIRLLSEPPAKVVGGEIRFGGVDLLKLSAGEMRRMRGTRLAMVFQDPFSSLDPVMRVGYQIGEGLRYGGSLNSGAIYDRVLEVMELVGVPEPQRRFDAYPHELSGGLRQRVAIAAALIRSPDILLADEPTTALDVTIQDQILRLLTELCRNLGMSVILVTHDLGIVAQTCQRVGVMYAGRLVELGTIEAVFRHPAHPYTEALLASIPQIGTGQRRLRAIVGSPPELGALPSGCAFAPRCPYAVRACIDSVPPLAVHDIDHAGACIRHAELSLVGRG